MSNIWLRVADEITLNLTVPASCEAVVTTPRLANGVMFNTITINGKAVELKLLPVAVCSFLCQKMPAFSAMAGHHEITFRSKAKSETMVN